MKLKAVAFDLDGTLYPYFKMYFCSIPLFLCYQHFIYHFSRVRLQLRKQGVNGDFREYQARLLAERLHIDSTVAYRKIDRIIYTKWENIFRHIKPYRYLETLLDALRLAGLRLAVLSDFPVAKKLSYLNLNRYFELAFTSEETGFLKPHNRPFQELTTRLRVRPEEILYVGDKYGYDILGAQQAGLKTAYLNPCGKPDRPADVVFKNYQEFLLLLPQILS